jgi:parallel beta-helix repeat protein
VHRTIIRLSAVLALLVALVASGSALVGPGSPIGASTAVDPHGSSPSPASEAHSGSVPADPPIWREVHVVADGSDDVGDGSLDRPWQTLAGALSRVSRGTAIRLGPGVFEGVPITTPGIALLGVRGETTIQGPLEIRADHVRLEELTLAGADRPHTGGVTVVRARGIVIRHNIVRDNSFGVYLIDAPEALIERNLVTGNAYGIEVHGESAGTRIERNDIVDNDGQLDDSRSAGGIDLYFTTGGLTVADNVLSGNDEVGIEVYGASDVVIRGNLVTGSTDAIETGTEDGRPCARLTVTQNVFYNGSIGAGAEERGVYIRCGEDSLVAANTFDGLDRFAIGIFAGDASFAGPVERLVIRDNILANGRAFSIDSAMPESVIIDSNLLFPCRSGNCPILGRQVAFVRDRGGTEEFETFRAWTGYEASGSLLDPRFVDRARRDYRLRQDSPAIGNAGALGVARTPADRHR